MFLLSNTIQQCLSDYSSANAYSVNTHAHYFPWELR